MGVTNPIPGWHRLGSSRTGWFVYIRGSSDGGGGHVGGKVSRKGPCVICGSYYWKLGSGQIRESDETRRVAYNGAVGSGLPW